MSDFTAQPALRGMAPVPSVRPGAPCGVSARLIQPGMVAVLARKDKIPALVEKAQAVFGLSLSDAPVQGRAASVAALGLGPGRWMFLGAAPGALQAAFDGLASVSDHGDGYATFEIWGPDARRALAKGVALDLEIFGDGDAAVTAVAHIGVILWKCGPGRFALAVFRSYAGSFWHWLSSSAAEFGLAVEDAAPGDQT